MSKKLNTAPFDTEFSVPFKMNFTQQDSIEDKSVFWDTLSVGWFTLSHDIMILAHCYPQRHWLICFCFWQYQSTSLPISPYPFPPPHFAFNARVEGGVYGTWNITKTKSSVTSVCVKLDWAQRLLLLSEWKTCHVKIFVDYFSNLSVIIRSSTVIKLKRKMNF